MEFIEKAEELDREIESRDQAQSQQLDDDHGEFLDDFDDEGLDTVLLSSAQDVHQPS